MVEKSDDLSRVCAEEEGDQILFLSKKSDFLNAVMVEEGRTSDNDNAICH